MYLSEGRDHQYTGPGDGGEENIAMAFCGHQPDCGVGMERGRIGDAKFDVPVSGYLQNGNCDRSCSQRAAIRQYLPGAVYGSSAGEPGRFCKGFAVILCEEPAGQFV